MTNRKGTCRRMEPNDTRTKCLACGRSIHTEALLHGVCITVHDGPSIGSKLATLDAARKMADAAYDTAIAENAAARRVAGIDGPGTDGSERPA